MAFVFSIIVFFIDHYCAGVSNKYCLFQFSFFGGDDKKGGGHEKLRK